VPTPQRADADWRFNFILIAILLGFVTLWIAGNTLLSDYSARFAYAPHWSNRIDVLLAIAALLAVAAFLALPISGWRRKPNPALALLGIFVLCLGPAALLWAILSSVTQAILFFLPAPTITQTGIVTASGASVPYRSRVQQIAEVRMSNGATIRLLAHNSIFAPYLHNEIKVNNTCALSRLPQGLPVTITMRASTIGNAIDRVSSAVACDRD